MRKQLYSNNGNAGVTFSKQLGTFRDLGNRAIYSIFAVLNKLVF